MLVSEIELTNGTNTKIVTIFNSNEINFEEINLSKASNVIKSE